MQGWKRIQQFTNRNLHQTSTRVFIKRYSSTTTIGYFYEYLGRKTKINFYIGCAILKTVKVKDESRGKFINMQCMWKAKDHRQTAQ
jgi:hypothetical protein